MNDCGITVKDQSLDQPLRVTRDNDDNQYDND